MLEPSSLFKSLVHAAGQKKEKKLFLFYFSLDESIPPKGKGLLWQNKEAATAVPKSCLFQDQQNSVLSKKNSA